MNDRYSPSRWAPWILALVVSVAVGIGAYQIGVSHAVVTTVQRADAPVQYVVPYHGFHPFGFVFPLFFLLFWFAVARFFFWGGPWRRRWYGHPGENMPPSFEEWHRQAHDRMKG